MASVPLYDLENIEFAVACLGAQRVSGLIDKMRHVDRCQWIGAFKDKGTADRNIAERFLGAQYRLRTAQAAKVENNLLGFRGHVQLPIAHGVAIAQGVAFAQPGPNGGVLASPSFRQPKELATTTSEGGAGGGLNSLGDGLIPRIIPA